MKPTAKIKRLMVGIFVCIMLSGIASKVKAGETSHFHWLETDKSVRFTGSLLLSGQLAPIGTEVGAFTSQGICVGGHTVTTVGSYDLEVYGKDDLNCYQQGANNGETIIFLVCANGNWYRLPQTGIWDEDNDDNYLELAVSNQNELLSAIPPVISELNPGPQSVVSAETTIDLSIQDNRAIDPSSLNLWVNCEQIVQAGEAAAGQTVTLGTEDLHNVGVTYLPSEPFDCGSYVEVLVQAGNQEGDFLTQKYYTFQIEDPNKPYVVERSPESGAIDVANDSSIVIRLNDDCTGIDKSDVQLWVEGADVTDSVVIEGTPRSRQLTYKPAEGFSYGEDILVLLITEDRSGNRLEEEYSFTISSDFQPPYVFGQSPSDGAVKVDPNTSISFYIRDDGRGIEGASITVNVEADGVPVSGDRLEEWASEAEVEIIFTPQTPFSSGQTIVVMIHVSDLAGHPFDTQYSFSLSDGVNQDLTPPYPAESDPNNNEIDVLGNEPVKIILKDDEAGVDRKSIKMYVNNNQVQWQEISGDANSYELTYYPVPPFTIGQTVAIKVEAKDLSSGCNSMQAEYSFSIGDLPQVVALEPLSGGIWNPAGSIQFQVLDEESGVDPNSLQIFIDNSEILLNSENLSIESLNQPEGIKVTIQKVVGKTFAPRQVVPVLVSASDKKGNRLKDFSYSFFVLDLVPPEEVSNLEAQAGDRTIDLAWSPSANTAGDLAGQKLYISQDGGEHWGSNAPGFDDNKAINLSIQALNYHLTALQNNIEYTCKLICVDTPQTLAPGDTIQNSSAGTIVSSVPRAGLSELELTFSSFGTTPIDGGVIIEIDGSLAFTLKAFYSDGFIDEVTIDPETIWQLSVAGVGTVDNQGEFWPINPGSTNIRASYGELWSNSVLVVVRSNEDNQSPNLPSTPGPANGVTNQSIDQVTLSWNGGDPDPDDVVFYDVYVDSNQSRVTQEKNLFFETQGITDAQCQLPELAYSTTYYWKVVARDSLGATVASELWSFTTLPAPPVSGSIMVTILPQEAAGAGAQWKITGESTWHNSGYLKSEVPFGTYQIEFKEITGWNTPSDKEVTISEANPDKSIESDPYILQTTEDITIEGTVVDLEGDGVSGAKVNAIAQDKGKPKVFSSAVSDNQGKFTLVFETEGTFYLTASKEGFGNSTLTSYATGQTDAVLTLTVLVSSSEIILENKRLTLIQISDNGILNASPFITLLNGKGTLSDPNRNTDSTIWEIKYTPGELDEDGDKIGIKIEPKGEGEGFGMNYFFTIHPTLSLAPYSKKVQTTFENAAEVVGQPVGKVVNENGGIIDADDKTTFVIIPDKLTTPFGVTRTIEITRTEVENSSAKGTIQTLEVTPMSAVYDFAFIDPVTGNEKGDEVNQITLRIKVSSSFDIDKWSIMISHDPYGPNPDWHFIEPVPGTVDLDGQYLTFTLSELYGQSVVITSSPDEQPSGDGGGSGGGGGCFIQSLM